MVLRALYPNRNEELKPGRYAGITMTLSQIDNAIAIPTEALIAEIDGEKVFVYRAGPVIFQASIFAKFRRPS